MMIQSKLYSLYSVHINPNFSSFLEYLFVTCKNQQRQQASLLAAVVDCDRKYVPDNVYGSYLRVMVEPRGVEALSDDVITDVFKGRVAFRVAWV